MRYLFLVSQLFFCGLALSQSTATIDSLNEISWNKIYSDKLVSVDAQEKAYNLSLKTEYKKGEAEALLNKGVLLFSNGDYPNALSNLHLALNISREVPAASSKKAILLNQIARIYIELDDDEKASEYLEEAVTMNRLSGDSSQLAGNYINLGIINANRFEFDSTWYYYSAALSIYEALSDTIGMITAYNNLGNYMAMNFRYGEERAYYHLAKELSGSNNELKAQVLYNISESFYAEEDYQSALRTALEAFELSEKEQYLNGLKITSNLISRIYEQTGRYEPALQFFRQYKAYSDSLFNDLTVKKLTETEMRSHYREQMHNDSLRQAKEDFERELEYENEISKQRTWTIAGSFGFLLMLALAGVLFRSNRVKQQANLVITRQKMEVEHQKEIVDEKNREIVDSINYARRLQEAILPPAKVVTAALPDSFILYKPKDIVAGDFYFLETIEERIHDINRKLVYFAVADCTGHGVPGAMVSVVGANGLKRCIREFGLRKPGSILDKLSELVREAFEQSEEAIRDGMDITLCCLDKENGTLSFAGANNPLWLINPDRAQWPLGTVPFTEGGGAEFKANKQPIGHYDHSVPFSTTEINIHPGDSIYLFSDGYVDQFGGEKGKKFKSAAFRKLLLSMQNRPMAQQGSDLSKSFEEWRGQLEQIDDVCVMGVLL